MEKPFIYIESESTFPSESEWEYVHRFSCEISLAGEDGPGTPIGHAFVEIIRHHDGTEDILGFQDTMDETGDLNRLFQILFDPDDGTLLPDVMDLIDEDRRMHPNVMVIDRVEIESDYRGQHIGQVAVETLIARFGSCCSLIAVQPFPFGVAKDNIDEFRAGLEKVKHFWVKAGFEQFQDTIAYIYTRPTYVAKDPWRRPNDQPVTAERRRA